MLIRQPPITPPTSKILLSAKGFVYRRPGAMSFLRNLEIDVASDYMDPILIACNNNLEA